MSPASFGAWSSGACLFALPGNHAFSAKRCFFLTSEFGFNVGLVFMGGGQLTLPATPFEAYHSTVLRAAHVTVERVCPARKSEAQHLDELRRITRFMRSQAERRFPHASLPHTQRSG
jgi:hypothetical protein